MNIKTLIMALMLIAPVTAICQGGNEINRLDQQGKKQGKWIKKYPGGLVMYEGVFKDDHPVGEFKRYYESSVLKSLMVYSPDGNTAVVQIYHPNGFKASMGKYIKQKKEGKWKFYSQFTNGCLVSEETYSENLRNGLSVKFYNDSTVAEKVNYVKDIKQGEWTRYFSGGKLSLKANYINGKLNGSFQVWFENGKAEFVGQYKDDVRDGEWHIYKNDGSLRYKQVYRDGLATDSRMDIDATRYVDSLEINAGKIEDPEKTGIIK